MTQPPDKEHISISDYQGLAKNSAWVMLSNLSLGFVLVMTVLGSRLLGDEVFGQYTFLVAVATVLADLSVLGTTEYVSIIAAREPERTGSLLANATGMRIPFSLAYLSLCALIFWLTMPQAFMAGLLIALDWVVRTFIHMLRAVLRARNRFGWDTQAVTLERLAVLLCAGAALLLTRSLVWFALGFFVGRLFGLLATTLAYHRLGERLRFAFERPAWSAILRGGVPIGLRSVLKGVSFRIDAFVLGLLRVVAEVGWYGAAYKFLEAGLLIQDVVGSSFLPAISRAFGRQNRDMVRDLYGRAYKLLWIVGGMAAAFASVNAGWVIDVVYGAEYANAAPALRLLVWAMPLHFGTLTTILLLDAVGSQGRTVAFFAIAVVGNLVLNLALVPIFGYLGAAGTTLATEFFLSAAMLWLALREGYTFPLQWLLGPVVAALAFAGTALLFPGSIWLGAALGLLAYTAVLVLMRVFDVVDIGFGKQLLLKAARR
jgi:O-antigen/teichoic acid export membrane protein